MIKLPVFLGLDLTDIFNLYYKKNGITTGFTVLNV